MAIASEGPTAPRGLRIVFWALVAAFALMLLTMLLPIMRRFMRPVFLPLMALCFLLGLALLVLALRWRQVGLLRTFWILTGASTTGLAVGSVLHNAFYGLGTVTGKWPILYAAMQGLEVAFFVLAVLICPVAFLVGTIGAVVVIVRRGGPTASTA
ncbi:MAG TPA: hypothetical protein VM366_02880 [Anaerolineae bacterium]|nr:hypothetical protein [Anaerolineae bacterium]